MKFISNHTSSDTDKILANPFDSSVVKTQLADAKAVQSSADNANKTAQKDLTTALASNKQLRMLYLTQQKV